MPGETGKFITIFVYNRIIITIRKHIAANKSLPGACKLIRIDESAYLGVIISALQVIEASLLRTILPRREETGDFI